jgi:hypothetical protein
VDLGVELGARRVDLRAEVVACRAEVVTGALERLAEGLELAPDVFEHGDTSVFHRGPSWMRVGHMARQSGTVFVIVGVARASWWPSQEARHGAACSSRGGWASRVSGTDSGMAATED